MCEPQRHSQRATEVFKLNIYNISVFLPADRQLSVHDPGSDGGGGEAFLCGAAAGLHHGQTEMKAACWSGLWSLVRGGLVSQYEASSEFGGLTDPSSLLPGQAGGGRGSRARRLLGKKKRRKEKYKS